jgi:inhibitor of KinA
VTRIVAAGDSARILEFDARIAPDVNTRAVAAAAHLRARVIPGVRDIVTAYHSVTVYFDPLLTDQRRLEALLRAAGDAAAAPDGGHGREVQIPVCYGGDFGPDLADVSRFAGLDEDAVVSRHAGGRYRVFMIGFVPGFAYLGVVDRAIAIPRRATPRRRVPAGSVGIAGQQTGVYPSSTPGGWQLIGRTPLTLFTPDRDEPCLLAPGDTVQFVPIDRAAFDRLAGV